MWVVWLRVARGESLLSQSKADVIISGARSNEQHVGGLVGRLRKAISDPGSYVTGKLYNSATNGQIGEWSARTTLMV